MPAPRRYSFALQSGETSDFLAVVDLPADVAEGDEGEEEDADELGEAVEILEVVCPDGVRAGDTIFLQYGADEIEVVVPEGIGPGDEFEVNLASESRDEQQTSVGDRIDDALDPTFVDAAAIAALIDEARSNTGHPGVLPLEAKLEALREKVRAPIESATDSAVAGSQPEPDAEIDLEKLLGDSAATLYGGASAQKPKKAKKPQRGQQVPKKPMKKTSGGPGSEAVGPGQLRLSGSELDRKVEQKMAALESKFSGSSPQARNRSNSLREFAKDQMQMIEAVVALDSEAKLAAVDEAEALETAAEAAAKAEAEAEAARAAAAKDAIESAAVAKVQQAAAVAEEALLAEADETKAAQAKLVEEAKQHAAALKAGNAARTKLERENSDLRSENSTLRRELAQLRIGQEVAEIGWRDERALHQEVIAAYARCVHALLLDDSRPYQPGLVDSCVDAATAAIIMQRNAESESCTARTVHPGRCGRMRR